MDELERVLCWMVIQAEFARLGYRVRLSDVVCRACVEYRERWH